MVRYVRFYTRWRRRENDQFSTLRCTKTGSTQPKLSTACFVVQSCLADADFVVFSNYCLIGTPQRMFFIFWPTRRDLNPHSPESESVALSNCATDGYSAVFSYGFLYLINLKVLPKLHTVLPVHSAILRVYL